MAEQHNLVNDDHIDIKSDESGTTWLSEKQLDELDQSRIIYSTKFKEFQLPLEYPSNNEALPHHLTRKQLKRCIKLINEAATRSELSEFLEGWWDLSIGVLLALSAGILVSLFIIQSGPGPVIFIAIAIPCFVIVLMSHCWCDSKVDQLKKERQTRMITCLIDINKRLLNQDLASLNRACFFLLGKRVILVQKQFQRHPAREIQEELVLMIPKSCSSGSISTEIEMQGQSSQSESDVSDDTSIVMNELDECETISLMQVPSTLDILADESDDDGL